MVAFTAYMQMFVPLSIDLYLPALPKMAEVFIPPDVNRGEYFIAWYARKIKA